MTKGNRILPSMEHWFVETREPKWGEYDAGATRYRPTYPPFLPGIQYIVEAQILEMPGIPFEAVVFGRQIAAPGAELQPNVAIKDIPKLRNFYETV